MEMVLSSHPPKPQSDEPPSMRTFDSAVDRAVADQAEGGRQKRASPSVPIVIVLPRKGFWPEWTYRCQRSSSDSSSR